MSEVYAIMVCLDVVNDEWVYVTEHTDDSKNFWDLKPVTFTSSLAAEDFADKWRLKDKERFVKVVTYES